MKNKRIVTLFVTVFMLVITCVPVFAGSLAKIKYLEHPDLFATLYGYIDFSDMLGVFQDKIAYSGELYGSDVKELMVGYSPDTITYIVPGTDVKTLSRVDFFYRSSSNPEYDQFKLKVSASGVKCGASAKKGILEMYCGGAEYILETE